MSLSDRNSLTSSSSSEESSLCLWESSDEEDTSKDTFSKEFETDIEIKQDDMPDEPIDWCKMVRTEFTKFPALEPGETDEAYFARMAQKCAYYAIDHPLKYASDDKLFEFLEKAVENDLETLADAAIKKLTQKLNVVQCKELFNALGACARTRPDIVLLLLPLIAEFSHEVRYEIIKEGCLAFIESKYRHEGGVFALLWNELPVEQRQVNTLKAKKAVDEVIQPFRYQIDTWLKLSSALTNIQCVLDSYTAEVRDAYIEDTLFFVHFSLRYVRESDFRTRWVNAVATLLSTCSEERRFALGARILQLAVSWASPGDTEARTSADDNFPAGFKRFLTDCTANSTNREEIRAFMIGKKDNGYLTFIARALHCAVVAFPVDKLTEQLAQLSGLSEVDKTEVIKQCIGLCVAGSVDLKKTIFLLNLLPKNVQTVFILRLFLDVLGRDVSGDLHEQRNLMSLSVGMELCAEILIPLLNLAAENQLAYFLNKSKQIQKLIDRFPAIDWRQLMQTMLLGHLTAHDSEERLRKLLAFFSESPQMDQALSRAFVEWGVDDDRAQKLLAAMPCDSSMEPAITYLNVGFRFRNPELAAKTFAKFYLRNQVGIPTPAILFEIVRYDAKNRSTVLATYFKYCQYSQDELGRLLEKAADDPTLKSIVWTALSHQSKRLALGYVLTPYNLSGQDNMLKRYNKCYKDLYEELSKQEKKELLIEMVARVARVSSLAVDAFGIHCLNVIGISGLQFETVAANALFRFLTPQWDLKASKNLLTAFSQKFGKKHGQKLEERTVDRVILKTLWLAAYLQKNQMIVALLNLPISWGLIEQIEMNECVETLLNRSKMPTAEKKFLSDVISPLICTVESGCEAVPPLAALPSRVGLYAVPGAALGLNAENIKSAFIAACQNYRDDKGLLKNEHDALAELLIACLQRLYAHANETSKPNEFSLLVMKMMMIGLMKFFDTRNSKKFAEKILLFRLAFPTFLIGWDEIEKQYGDIIAKILNTMISHTDSSPAGLAAELMMTQISFAYAMKGVLTNSAPPSHTHPSAMF